MINNFSLSITKIGLIPIFITGTAFAKIFPSLSIILDLKFSFFKIFFLKTLSSRLNKITFDEKITAIIKKTKKINAILSNEILMLDLFSL